MQLTTPHWITQYNGVLPDVKSDMSATHAKIECTKVCAARIEY
jgi:hypothetical protein